jgi:tetratricopeptide (TPR) repeat protein
MKRRGVNYVACKGLLFIGALSCAALGDVTFDRLIAAGNYTDAVKYAESNIPVATRDADIWAKLGIAYEKQNLNDKAMACYMVSQRSGKNYDAYLGAARLYNNQKQPEAALDMAKKAMDIKSTGEASWEFTRASIALGKPAEAKAALEQVVKSDPSNTVAMRELGLIYYKEGDFANALPLLKAHMRNESSSETAVMIAACFRAQKQFDSAIAYLKVASQNPAIAHGSAGLELARIYFAQEQYQASIDAYAKADPAQLTATDLYQYAMSQEKSGVDEDTYMKTYNAATAKFGSSVQNEALLARAKCSRYDLKKKNFAEAFAQVEPLYTADPQGKVIKDVGFMIVDALVGMGNGEKAIPYLDNIIATNPQSVEAYGRLLEIYGAMGRADKAQAIQEKLASLEPNNPKILLAFGQYNLKIHKNTEALHYFQKSFMLEPAAEAAEGMTQAAWETKQYNLARDAAESALHYDSSLTIPQRILALIYISDQNYPGARQLLEKIVKRSPGDKELWVDLALCYEKMNDLQMLAEADKTIMSLDKHDVPSRARYARYALSTNNLREALSTYKELMVLEPRDPAIVKNLADISTKLGNSSDAVLYLSKYVALVPTDAAAQRDLGNFLYDRKDFAGALAAYRASLIADPAIKGFFKKYAELVITLKAPDQDVVSVLSAAVKAGEGSEMIYSTLGSLYQKQGLFPQAIEMYQQTLLINPQNFEALSSMASCQAKSGKISEAIVSYEQASALKPGSAPEQKALGDLYLQQGKKGPAIAAYKRYLEKAPADSRVARMVGDYEFDQKNYKDAVLYLGKVTGEESGKPDYLLRYGTAAYQLGDFKTTEELFKRLIVLAPKDAEPFRTLYQIAKKNNDLPSAGVYLKKYTALQPNNDTMLLALGDLLYTLKDFPGSLAAYRATLKANPSARGFYERYVSLISTLGTTQELVEAINGAIAANEANVAMYSRLGAIYRNASNFPKAIQMYEQASRLDPKNGALLSALAECQAKNGNAEAAVVSYEQAIVINPEATKDYKALGDLYMQFKKTEAAVRAYKKYLGKNQDNAIARFVGEQAIAQKNYPEAVKYLGMIGGSDAQSPQFLLVYANTCYQARRDSMAIQIYKKLAGIMPQNAEVFNTLYELTLRTGTKDEALLYLKKYAELKPQDAPAQRMLGDLLYERKDRAGALKAYRALVKADSTAKGFYARYADLVIQEGNELEIVTVLSAAIAAGEADVGMYTRLGNIYRKQGQYAKAASMFEHALQLDPKNAELLSALAECQVKNNNGAAAALTYEQAIAMNPSAASSEYKALGDLYLAQKKTDMAIRSYKKYVDKNPKEVALAKYIGEQEYKAKNYTEAKKYLGMVTGDEARTIAFLQIYGKASYAAGDLPTALATFKQLAALTPKDAEVFRTIYEICGKLNKPDDGIAYLKQYVALQPTDADAQKLLGDLLYDKKDSLGALGAYQAALKANPALKGFYKRYVDLVLKFGRLEDHVAALNGAIAAGEADAGMYSVLADLCRKAGNCEKAIPLYGKALDSDPKNTTLIFSQADCQAKTGKIAEATISYEQALAMNSSEIKEYKTLGDLYMQQKKTDDALRAYKKYLVKYPSDVAIAKIVGKAAFAAKNYGEAFTYYGLVTNDETPDYLAEYGLSAIQTNNLPTGIAALEKLRSARGEIGGLRATAYKALADSYEKSGNSQKAADVLNSYVRLPGVKDPDAAYRRAVVYENIDPVMATTMYEENIKEYPTDYRNFFKLGNIYAKDQATAAKGIKYLEQCAALADSVPQVWFDLGQLYATMDNRTEMLKAFRKYINLDRTNAPAMLKIGETLLSKQMPDQALIYLESANNLKSNDPMTMTLLARAYLHNKRRDDAAKMIEKISSVTNGKIDDDLRAVLVDVYLESGNYGQAITEINNLLAKKQTNALLLKLAKALYEVGKYTDAAKAVETIKASEPENLDAIMILGKIQVAQNNYDDAIETYKEALYINPNFAQAMLERANIYMLQTKLPWAKQFYERALKVDPKLAMAHLGLARVAKASNDSTTYKSELDKARELDPQNSEIINEAKSQQ